MGGCYVVHTTAQSSGDGRHQFPFPGDPRSPATFYATEDDLLTACTVRRGRALSAVLGPSPVRRLPWPRRDHVSPETLGALRPWEGPWQAQGLAACGQSREEPLEPGLPFPDGSVPTVTSTAVVSEASGGLWMIIYRPGGGDKAVVDACLCALYGS